jgi:hypothetical protein
MLRWRTDKKAADADTLETLRRLLPPEAGPERPATIFSVPSDPAAV